MDTVVKLKAVDKIYQSGNFDTTDYRWTGKCPLKKIIKFCLKNEIPFKVAIRENTVLKNRYNYIELYDFSFTKGKDLTLDVIKFLNKISIKRPFRLELLLAEHYFKSKGKAV